MLSIFLTAPESLNKLLFLPAVEAGWPPKVESFDEALLSLPWLCIDVDDDPLELTGPGPPIALEWCCFIILNALDEAICGQQKLRVVAGVCHFTTLIKI